MSNDNKIKLKKDGFGLMYLEKLIDGREIVVKIFNATFHQEIHEFFNKFVVYHCHFLLMLFSLELLIFNEYSILVLYCTKVYMLDISILQCKILDNNS